MRRKKKAWSKLNITIVTPSNWLAECAKKSSLFSGHRIEVIHNGLNLDLFKPINKTIACEICDLPNNKKLILFGAMSATSDHRKGFELLYEGLKQLSAKWSDKTELVVFGASEPENRHKELCLKAREKAVACFDIENVAKQYESLYQEITA